MTLRGLIDAVEAGSSGDDFWSAVHVIGARHITDVTRARDGSLDAAKRLHDALLPGWEVDEINQSLARRIWTVRLGCNERRVKGEAADPARAWLLTILRALEARP